MELHLNDGTNRAVRVGARTIGLAITGVTFGSEDLYKLLQMKDGELREYLGVLSTRFRPPTKETT
jgi:hypothetical protein